MKVYVFLADGFEEIEAISVIDILRRASIEVCTVSISNKKIVRGAHEIEVLADSVFDEVTFEDEKLLVLPGGMPGAQNLEAHCGLTKLLVDQAQKGKLIAAICAAPFVLGKNGLLNGLEVICYPGFESQLGDVTLSAKKVVKSGSIITAMGAGVAVEFGLKIVEELEGVEKAHKIAKLLCC